MPVADIVDHIHPVCNSFEVYELYHKEPNALKVFLSKIYFRGSFAGTTKCSEVKYIMLTHTNPYGDIIGIFCFL